MFVAGTGTEVGKTWWTAAARARAARPPACTVAARKPVQSGNPGDATDADAARRRHRRGPRRPCARRTARCPSRGRRRWPPRELGVAPFTTADLAGGVEWPASVDVGLVEGVGGPRSPISDDGDNVDLVRLLAPDLVVLVADAGLGTINAVRLSTAVLAGFPVIVALNRYGTDPLHARNLEHLTDVDGFDVVTTPRELADRVRGR